LQTERDRVSLAALGSVREGSGNIIGRGGVYSTGICRKLSRSNKRKKGYLSEGGGNKANVRRIGMG